MNDLPPPSHAEKVSAKAYIDGSGILSQLNECLNEASGVRPADTAGYIADALSSRAGAQPIEQLTATEALTSEGVPAVLVTVHACIRGRSGCVAASAIAPSAPHASEECQVSATTAAAAAAAAAEDAAVVAAPAATVAPSSKGNSGGGGGGAGESKKTSRRCTPVGIRAPVQLVDVNNTQRHGGLGALDACDAVSKILSPAVTGLDLRDPRRVDAALWGADDTNRKMDVGGNTISAASCAVAIAGAYARRLPLYEHMRTSHGLVHTPHLPIPVFTLISGLGATDGKLKLRAISVMPARHHSIELALRHAGQIYTSLRRAARAKGKLSPGHAALCGGLAVPLDKPEQALEMVRTACEACGIEPGVDVHLVLDAGAGAFYDAAKGKYDGKVTSDYVDDLLAKCSQYKVGLVIDPLAPDDIEGWRDLVSRPHPPILAGDICQSDPDLLHAQNNATGTEEMEKMTEETQKEEEEVEKEPVGMKDMGGATPPPPPSPQLLAEGLRLHISECGTISRLVASAQKAAKQLSVDVALALPHSGGDVSSLTAELATALGATYYLGGAPTLPAWARMLEVEADLDARGQVRLREPLETKLTKPKAPRPSVLEEASSASSSKEKNTKKAKSQKKSGVAAISE